MYRVNQGWLHGAVKPYFKRHGIELMREDVLFLEKCLSRIPPESHRKSVRDYFEKWMAEIERNRIVRSNGSNARFEANTFLRLSSGGDDD